LTYIKLIKYLKENFHVYAFDIVGMGLSSRPEVQPFAEIYQNIQYFLDTMKIYIDSLGLKERIILVGHSFGGYLVG